ncbi:MAG: NUDIX hydrolase [Candidatus Woesearchaeota archaeon]
MPFFFPIQNPDEGVYVALLVHDYKILLLKHKKHEHWFFPHGYSLLQEIPDDTLKRICLDQTRIIANPLEYSPIADQNDTKRCAIPLHNEMRSFGSHKVYCSYYLCKAMNPNDAIASEDHGIVEMRWYTKDELLALNLPQGILDICILSLEKQMKFEF